MQALKKFNHHIVHCNTGEKINYINWGKPQTMKEKSEKSS